MDFKMDTPDAKVLFYVSTSCPSCLFGQQEYGVVRHGEESLEKSKFNAIGDPS